MPKCGASWVKYREMGGPRFRGTIGYNPARPWGVWTQIMGVIARCEGKHDTVVMYDETGVTAGFLQWTLKSGRLQKLLQSFKGVSRIAPGLDASGRGTFEHERTLFQEVCETSGGIQLFSQFNFNIKDGNFVLFPSMRSLSPNVDADRQLIVDTCMARRTMLSSKQQQQAALDLCCLFAEIFQDEQVQAATIAFAKAELNSALDVTRPPLAKYGCRTIRDLLPEGAWGTPLPAIFFNLFQNSPGGAFTLFGNAMNIAVSKGVAKLTKDTGFEIADGRSNDGGSEDLLDIVWRRLNQTAYADWGFKSKQYLESGGKNPPRIMNIGPAISEFYGLTLQYYK